MSADFFSNLTLTKNLSTGLTILYNSSGLIWVQTVCQGYQQTTLVDKELTVAIKHMKVTSCVLKVFQTIKMIVLCVIYVVYAFNSLKKKNFILDITFFTHFLYNRGKSQVTQVG